MTRLARHFSGTYAEARQKFLDAANALGLPVDTYEHDKERGRHGEALATDVVRVGPADAQSMLVLTSGTHGVEGFCGSGCQVAMMNDPELVARLAPAGVCILFIHAVNPYGFSHLRRTNEDNVDVNRNNVDFNAPRPVNAGYKDIDALLMPASWPPDGANAAALGAYAARHGVRAFREAVTKGQYDFADGLFYGGSFEVWSTRTMRAIMRKHGAGMKRIGCIDLHTGLGPRGHGEKLYAGVNDAAELTRARAWWGSDVFALFEPGAVSVDTDGPMIRCVYNACPDAEVTILALEYGTQPDDMVIGALRGDQWLYRHPEQGPKVRAVIKQALRDAFYCEDDDWKGMVAAQARVAALQAVQGLRNSARTG